MFRNCSRIVEVLVLQILNLSIFHEICSAHLTEEHCFALVLLF